jgi:L-fuconolactonase
MTIDDPASADAQPASMRIDAHLHHWQPACNFDNRPVADQPFYRRDFMPADARAALDACRIDGVILVQTAPQTEETDWCIRLASETPRIWGVTAWVDLDGAPVDFGALARRPKVVGIRAQLRRIADSDFIARPQVTENLAAALHAKLGVVLLGEARHYAAVSRALDRLPPGPLTVNHLALPAPDMDAEPWRAFMRRLAERPDTFVQFSGIPFCFGAQWRDGHARACMEDALRILGPQRMLYASDWPMLLRFAQYEEWFETAWKFFATLAPKDVAAIFAGNALRANPRLRVPQRTLDVG